jgi:hypothetical protein
LYSAQGSTTKAETEHRPSKNMPHLDRYHK